MNVMERKTSYQLLPFHKLYFTLPNGICNQNGLRKAIETTDTYVAFSIEEKQKNAMRTG